MAREERFTITSMCDRCGKTDIAESTESLARAKVFEANRNFLPGRIEHDGKRHDVCADCAIAFLDFMKQQAGKP